MFMLAFFFGALSNFPRLTTSFENIWILKNLTLWGLIPILSSFFIASIYTLSKSKKFDKAFQIYLITLGLTIILILNPIPMSQLTGIIYPFLSITVIFIASFSLVRNRELPNLLFLISIVTLVLAEMGRNLIDSGLDFIILGYISAYFFLFLVFVTSKEKNSSISSFFSLQKKLHETEKELKESQEKLVKSEKLAAIGQAATMVGHDLRNPLQAIENASYFVEKQIKQIDPENQIFQKSIRMLKIINDSVEYANKIVLDLKDFSSERIPELRWVNIKESIEEALKLCKIPTNIEIIKELTHSPQLKLDKAMITRVFVNIISNGVQAMPNGGTLQISIKTVKDFVEVSFEDTGSGMSKETIKKLFNPFFTTKSQGMGMGLAICKKFVELNGGRIDVESKEFEGSKFTIKLPHLAINQD